MMTKEERAAARKLCDEATPGPWATSILDEAIAPECMSVAAAYGGQRIYARAGADYPAANAAFIAGARSALPAALDDIDKLHDQVKGLGAVVDHHGATIMRLEADLAAARAEGKQWADAIGAVQAAFTGARGYGVQLGGYVSNEARAVVARLVDLAGEVDSARAERDEALRRLDREIAMRATLGGGVAS